MEGAETGSVKSENIMKHEATELPLGDPEDSQERGFSALDIAPVQAHIPEPCTGLGTTFTEENNLLGSHSKSCKTLKKLEAGNNLHNLYLFPECGQSENKSAAFTDQQMANTEEKAGMCLDSMPMFCGPQPVFFVVVPGDCLFMAVAADYKESAVLWAPFILKNKPHLNQHLVLDIPFVTPEDGGDRTATSHL
ncbi:hypothetical protein NDU88_000018 [Pleurodeles waltl]|uniref:Uncharacterized protein n=1 Tax=Pleurodeles waltl TaxID=8319 RepID=A0AAV7WGW7_PLEWA|nr:hypothetical protein NDU88_000018 [Pleurodeles waltl]